MSIILIGIELGKLLVAGGFEAVKLLAFDHNWDAPEFPIEVL